MRARGQGVAELDAAIDRARKRLRALQAKKAALVRGRTAAIVADFDAGCLNVEKLADRHGTTVNSVRAILRRNGRSVIFERHRRLQAARSHELALA